MRLRVVHFFWIAVMIAILFVALCLRYWDVDWTNAARCIYGRDTCSQTIATWFLVFFTATAFLAAFAAARFAARTYRMETQTALGQTPCPEQDHDPLVNIYLLETFSEPLVNRKPPGFDPAEFIAPITSDFQNLGRTAIIQARVTLYFENAAGTRTKRVIVPLGNIPRDRDVAVRLWISKKLEEHDVRAIWTKPVFHSSGDYDLPFYPYRQVDESEYILAVDDIQTLLKHLNQMDLFEGSKDPNGH